MKLKNLFSIQALYSILLLLPLFNASAETSFIFAHGISGSERCGQHYADITGLPFTIFNFPPIEESDAGQRNDLSELNKAYRQTDKNSKRVLFGLSRGGSAAINYASKKPKNLAAIIAESPFDSLENVAKKELVFLAL